ncbi:GNAT family N-acetyltransferase [Pseudomonas sp. GCM10022188]|uniref:GNAT family N-acetyltransferase n=1 Tax=Pseudomonas TaxID=286 RepID=UPI001E3306C1|nr:GNAT family N-acetyltransferase [Pseudomonas oryzagri]MCC6076917.1 GNAT family N-acetyltransferase [Pseudomonas oryzagri]
MKISEISSKNEWDEALAKAAHHDFYHTWDFHLISQRNGEGDPVLFEVRTPHGGVLFPLLSRPIAGSSRRDLTSVYGYPSPLSYGLIDRAEIAGLWDSFLSHLSQRGYVSLFSRCHPFLTPEVLGEDAYQPCGRVVVIPLEGSEEQQRAAYRTNHKRDLRKLERLGVVCQADDSPRSLADFMAHYEATMRSLNAAPYYYFSRDYYQGLLAAESFATHIYSCSLEGRVICSGIFVFCDQFVQYHLGGTAPDFVHLAPTKLMFDTVRRDASRLGYQYFCLGGGHGSQEDSLFRFKAGFSSLVRDFRLIRKIVDHDEYQRLCVGVADDTSYFPRYRATPHGERQPTHRPDAQPAGIGKVWA